MCLIVGAALLTWYGAILAAVGVVLLLACCYSKRDGLLILGPVALSELSRRVRRPRAWMWRTLYAAAAGVLLVGIYVDRVGWSAENAPQKLLNTTNDLISGWFIAGFLIAVVVLSLQLFPSAIVEDRIAKRWDLLRATDLRPREILLGKFFGRLPIVLEPLLAAAPIVAVLPLYGEVSPLMVLSLLLGCVGLMFGLGGVGLFYSLFSKKGNTASSSTVMFFFLYFFASGGLLIAQLRWPYFPWLFEPVFILGSGNPFVQAYYFSRGGSNFEHDLLLAAWRFALFNFAVFFLFLFVAVRRLPRAEVWVGKSIAAMTPMEMVARIRKQPVVKPAKVAVDRPPVPDDSIAWWERYGWLTAGQMKTVHAFHGPRLLFATVSPWVLAVAIVVVAVLFGGHAPSISKIAVGITTAMLTIGGCMALVPPAFRAARCMAKEREADTYEPLLLTALSGQELLSQKWHGIALCDLPIYKALWAVSPTVLVGGFLPFAATVLGLLALPFAVGALAAIGLAVGVNAKSQFRAATATGFVLFVVYMVLSLVGGIIAMVNNQRRYNSPRASPLSEEIIFVVCWLVGLAVCTAIGFGFFRLAVKRFGTGRPE